MEVGGEGDYIPIATHRYRMIPAVRWAAMSANLMFQWEVMDKVTRQCPQTTAFLRERRTEAVSNRGPSTYQPHALPLGQNGSHIYTHIYGTSAYSLLRRTFVGQTRTCRALCLYCFSFSFLHRIFLFDFCCVSQIMLSLLMLFPLVLFFA